MCKEVSEEQFVKAEETVYCASDHTVEPGMHLEPCERQFSSAGSARGDSGSGKSAVFL